MGGTPDELTIDRLRYFDNALIDLMELADQQEDHLLGALLCTAHKHVLARYAHLRRQP